MIKAITFDFWLTLYGEDEPVRTKRRERRVALVQGFFAAAGRPREAGQVRAALEAAAERAAEAHRAEQRNLTHEEIGRLVGRELGLELTADEGKALAELVSSVGRMHPPVPLDFAGHLLARLDGKAALGIISDTNLTFGADLRAAMESHGLAKYFRQFTWSDETMTAKPMARQFLYTLSMLDARPDEAVHVGDLEDRDVGGARAAGMRAIRVLHGADGQGSQADAVVPTLAGVPAVLKRWGLAV